MANLVSEILYMYMTSWGPSVMNTCIIQSMSEIINNFIVFFKNIHHVQENIAVLNEKLLVQMLVTGPTEK